MNIDDLIDENACFFPEMAFTGGLKNIAGS
jgi:hypothetical protein